MILCWKLRFDAVQNRITFCALQDDILQWPLLAPVAAGDPLRPTNGIVQRNDRCNPHAIAGYKPTVWRASSVAENRISFDRLIFNICCALDWLDFSVIMVRNDRII